MLTALAGALFERLTSCLTRQLAFLNAAPVVGVLTTSGNWPVVAIVAALVGEVKNFIHWTTAFCLAVSEDFAAAHTVSASVTIVPGFSAALPPVGAVATPTLVQ